ANGFTITGADTTISGFAINRFAGSGIRLSGAAATHNAIAGNFIGTDATGTIDRGNKGSGVTMIAGAHHNAVGGAAPGLRNVLSGNSNTGASRGILISGSDTDNNVVIGNYIGVNAAGTAAITNDNTGILVTGGPKNNVIGGPTAAERNLISGNTLAGIAFQGT